MPITDSYVVAFLLQETAGAEPLRWMDTGSGEFAASLNGVTVRLGECESRSGRRLLLQLEYDETITYIWEPERHGLFGRRFDGREAEGLASDLRRLLSSVRRACLQKEAARDMGAERQEIYRRLLFAGSGSEG
jgi:hypothetical protein